MKLKIPEQIKRYHVVFFSIDHERVCHLHTIKKITSRTFNNGTTGSKLHFNLVK